MSLEVTSAPNAEDENRIIDETRSFNLKHIPKDVEPLCVFDRLANGEIVAGLIGKTYWNYLDIAFLWVADAYRNEGRATAIVKAAENEAIQRGCRQVLLDTYSFQALGFYKKLGYEEYGTLCHFAGEHTRHYLRKDLQTKQG
ncbi:N-acetyltransferase [Oceaniferula spumae]|uniref:N-acetyltransferase n=1 Tax=Oceaniferula spumae TaxID=2979115 RepID=A0AAT9FN31_9BACT